jgi:sulfur-carrier protein
LSVAGEVRLVLFASAREAAGCSSTALPVSDLATLLATACRRFGEQFTAVLETSRVWVNGDEPIDGLATRLQSGDEVAVLPPVSGGCTA